MLIENPVFINHKGEAIILNIAYSIRFMFEHFGMIPPIIGRIVYLIIIKISRKYVIHYKYICD